MGTLQAHYMRFGGYIGGYNRIETHSEAKIPAGGARRASGELQITLPHVRMCHGKAVAALRVRDLSFFLQVANAPL